MLTFLEQVLTYCSAKVVSRAYYARNLRIFAFVKIHSNSSKSNYNSGQSKIHIKYDFL